MRESHRRKNTSSAPANGDLLQAELGSWLASRDRGPAPDTLRLRVAGIASQEPHRRAPLSITGLLRPAAALGAVALVAAFAFTALLLRGNGVPQASAPAPSASLSPSASLAPSTWQPVNAGPLPSVADLVTWLWYLGWIAVGLLLVRLLILGPRWSAARWIRTAASARDGGDRLNESTEPILSLYTRAIGGRLRRLGSDPDGEAWTPEEAPVAASDRWLETPSRHRLVSVWRRVRGALTGRASTCFIGLGLVGLFIYGLASVYVSSNDVLAPVPVQMTDDGAGTSYFGSPGLRFACGSDARVRFAMWNTSQVSVVVLGVWPIEDVYARDSSPTSEVLLPPGPTMDALPLWPTPAGPWYSEPMRPFELKPGQATTLGLALRTPQDCNAFWFDSVRVQYSVLGVGGSDVVALPDQVYLGY